MDQGGRIIPTLGPMTCPHSRLISLLISKRINSIDKSTPYSWYGVECGLYFIRFSASRHTNLRDIMRGGRLMPTLGRTPFSCSHQSVFPEGSKLESDEFQMRNFFEEGDLLVAEV